MTELSDYERATVERIEAAEAAPESYFVRRIVAEELRAAAYDVDDGEFSSRESAAARATILARADELDPPL